MTNVLLPCRLDCSGVAVGAAVGAAQHVAPTEGGGNTTRWGGATSPRPCSAVSVRVFRPTPSVQRQLLWPLGDNYFGRFRCDLDRCREYGDGLTSLWTARAPSTGS